MMHQTAMAEPFTELATAPRIADGLRRLGIGDGDLVCLHVSMSALGLVIGGCRAVIDGVTNAVGAAGTLMMPSYSGDLSDPAEWRHPPVPEGWVDEIRNATPPYEPGLTPTRGMGAVAEYFRTCPDVRRSGHPQSSFAARGRLAEQLLDPHPLDNRFGPSGPLGRLGPLGAKIVLLGAPFDTVSLFHLSQHLVGWSKPVAKSAPVLRNGASSWASYEDVEYPIDWFDDAVAVLLEEGTASEGQVCAARTVVFPAQAALDRVVAWRKENQR